MQKTVNSNNEQMSNLPITNGQISNLPPVNRQMGNPNISNGQLLGSVNTPTIRYDICNQCRKQPLYVIDLFCKECERIFKLAGPYLNLSSIVCTICNRCPFNRLSGWCMNCYRDNQTQLQFLFDSKLLNSLYTPITKPVTMATPVVRSLINEAPSIQTTKSSPIVSTSSSIVSTILCTNCLIRSSNPTYNLCQLCYETIHSDNSKTKTCISCHNEKTVPGRNWCKPCIEYGKSTKWCKQCYKRFSNGRFGFCKRCYNNHLKTTIHKSGLCKCCGIKLASSHYIICANCNIAGQTACFYHGFCDCICFAVTAMPFYEFCNSFEIPIIINSITFKTVEHYYQANKFSNESIFMKVVDCVSTELIIDIIKTHKKYVNPAFNRISIMRHGLMTKFTQHGDLTKKLLQTGTKNLVFLTEDEIYWGFTKKGHGINMLGCLLMEIRDEIRQQLETRKYHVNRQYGILQQSGNYQPDIRQQHQYQDN